MPRLGVRTGRFKKLVGNAARDVAVLRLALKDPRTPFLAKAIAGAVVFYALSPIDLIPDFIPVLGQLDDLVVVPLGLLLASKMVPPDLLEEFRRQAIVIEHAKIAQRPARRRRMIFAAIVLIILAGLIYWAWTMGWIPYFRP
ncbi:MAG: DUF1232 domain-containing protein [Caulobacterales bacterium]